MNEELPQQIREQLQTRWLGQQIIYLRSTTSTNDVAKDAAVADGPEGLVVLAEQQTAGRGRRGRPWLAPPGSSILMSVLLRPPFPPPKLFSLTMLAGSAAVAGVERLTGLRCDLKWPNDIMVDNRKLGGILTEASLGADDIDFAVVGLGLNVNVDLADEPSLEATATSLSRELGREVSRALLIRDILKEIETRYEAARRGDLQVIFEEWRARLATLGTEVVVTDGLWSEAGLAYDVDLDGTLLLRRHDGRLLRVIAGDVSLREAR